jgi:hypothetical protein
MKTGVSTPRQEAQAMSEPIKDLFDYIQLRLVTAVNTAQSNNVREQAELVSQWWNSNGASCLKSLELVFGRIPALSPLKEKAGSSINAIKNILESTGDDSESVDDMILSLLEWTTEVPSMLRDSFENMGLMENIVVTID